MIVRINQLDPNHAQADAGWGSQGMLGPLRHQWAADVCLYELLILESDEQSRPVSDLFRQEQLRQLIPEAAAALRQQGVEQIVLRLDGPIGKEELSPALSRVSALDDTVRFALSPVRKLHAGPQEEVASFRVQPSDTLLRQMCADPALGLHRSVRLRLFALPERLVNPLLDIDSIEDERWDEVLPACGFVLATTPGLRSLEVTTRRFDPTAMKDRLVGRLMGAPK
jgi:hypothetical protein